jgi:hypothetical protein
VLESIVGFLAKIAFWAFLAGAVFGIYLGVRYWPEQHQGADAISCVAPAPSPPGGPAPSG